MNAIAEALTTAGTPALRRQLKVFIAEDSPIMCPRIAQLALQVDDVVICGTTALAADVIPGIDASDPDALILDIHLRDGNALPNLRWATLCHPHTLAIVCSNSATESYRAAAFAAGADHFLDKSLECERIPEILANFKTQVWTPRQSAAAQ